MCHFSFKGQDQRQSQKRCAPLGKNALKIKNSLVRGDCPNAGRALERRERFSLRGLCRGRSLALPKEPKARRVLNDLRSGRRHQVLE